MQITLNKFKKKGVVTLMFTTSDGTIASAYPVYEYEYDADNDIRRMSNIKITEKDLTNLFLISDVEVYWRDIRQPKVSINIRQYIDDLIFIDIISEG